MVDGPDLKACISGDGDLECALQVFEKKGLPPANPSAAGLECHDAGVPSCVLALEALGEDPRGLREGKQPSSWDRLRIDSSLGKRRRN